MNTSLIEKAFENGLIMNHEKVKKLFSKREWNFIIKKVPYVDMAMEIRRLRVVVRMSQIKLAKKMHVKREFISRIESGVQNMTLTTILKIASATGKEFKFSFE